MRKLIIYRGETRHGEVTLTGKTMRIGRSGENDVILEDPGKGVSRAHAELRPEGDQYRLVDLKSQNGIWVSGQRVPSVLLTPGVVAAMGPYRVAVDAASPATHAFTPVTEPAPPDTETEHSRPVGVASEVVDSPTPLASPVAVSGAGALLDPPTPLASARPLEPTVPPTDAPAAAKPAAAKPTPAKPVTSNPPRPSSSTGTATVKQAPPVGGRVVTVLASLALTLLLIAASAIGAYKFVQYKRSAAARVWDSAVATTLVNNGKCQEALDTQINPALRANPNDAAALALKQRCAPPPVQPPPPQPPPVQPPQPTQDAKATATQRLDEAEASIAANACQGALDTINAVLADDPNDERARALAAKANACLNPVAAQPKSAPADANAKITPVDGVEPKQGETKTAYTTRTNEMRKVYQDATTALQEQRWADALKILETLPSGYRDVAQQRAAAQTGMRNDASRAYAAAVAAEQRQDWAAATRNYQRAAQLDGRDVTGDLNRMADQKNRIGQQACRDGEAQYLYGHNAEAAQLFQRVLDTLPASDPCYATARERLATIRK